ncbi:40155_t:CDS:2 [Gigaspora margarita]|uniref:40155_t:CDS:1 n=1 Tax=Gigaspora margarita TaxID=4874 RepID=A0ABN7UU34_GIGMA|nr:40155_t:CDS:2 [Gigaspora margarita]
MVKLHNPDDTIMIPEEPPEALKEALCHDVMCNELKALVLKGAARSSNAASLLKTF